MQIRRMNFRAIAVCAFALTIEVAHAGVRIAQMPAPVEVGQRTNPYIEIFGVIDPSDVSKLKAAFGQTKGIVALNSPGGDVSTAMELGRIIRKSGRAVAIESGAGCISACVFILAGGSSRLVQGKVGIHRPYFTQDRATSPADQKANYSVIESTVKSYLSEMNVSVALYDDMFRISPSSVRFLSVGDLSQYGLLGVDPYVEEATTTALANDLHISKEEYLRREAKVKTDCRMGTPGFGECAVAIQYGISLEEFKRREGLAQKECDSADRIAFVRCEQRITRGF